MEGAKDLRVIPYLMEANGVVWVPDVDPVVHIAPNNGAEQLLKQGVIESELRASGFEALGVVIDANSSPITRTLQPSLHQSSPNWGTRKSPRTVYVSSCIGAAGNGLGAIGMRDCSGACRQQGRTHATDAETAARVELGSSGHQVNR